MVTMQDIAAKAGVSTTTVSRVLNTKNSAIPISTKTRAKVLRIAREMGYSPNMYAKTLRTKKSMLIGLVVWDLTDFFFSEIIRGIENTLHSSGYYLLLNSSEADVERERICLEKMRDLHVDGILLVGGTADSYRHSIDEVGIHKSSIVLIGTAVEGEDINSVTVDNYTGGYIGMEYLLNLSRKRYVYLSGTQKTMDMEKRLMGVRQAVEDFFALEKFEDHDAGPGEQAGYDAAMDFLPKLDLPAAVFAVSDLTAFGVLRAVKDLNLRVPEDIAVMGFDDISMSTFFFPRLSTIRQPRYKMGEIGATLLLDSIKKRAQEGDENYRGEQSVPGKQILLSPELVSRESS